MKAKGNNKNFSIVCVGGSAGGLDAYIRLLENLPADMGVAIVIVNHLRISLRKLYELHMLNQKEHNNLIRIIEKYILKKGGHQ